MTRPRVAILEILRRELHPLSPRQIHAALPPGRCDLATVYRSIHLLEKMEMVKRYDFGDGVARFELLRGDHHGHHHHLVCTSCSQVVELQECLVSEVEQRIASSSGFRGVTHKLEFFGICPACQR